MPQTSSNRARTFKATFASPTDAKEFETRVRTRIGLYEGRLFRENGIEIEQGVGPPTPCAGHASALGRPDPESANARKL
jgi:hypothetical protein